MAQAFSRIHRMNEPINKRTLSPYRDYLLYHPSHERFSNCYDVAWANYYDRSIYYWTYLPIAPIQLIYDVLLKHHECSKYKISPRFLPGQIGGQTRGSHPNRIGVVQRQGIQQGTDFLQRIRQEFRHEVHEDGFR